MPFAYDLFLLSIKSSSNGLHMRQLYAIWIVVDIVFVLTGNYIRELTRVKVYNYRTKFEMCKQVYSQVVTKRLNEIWFHLTTPYFSNHNYLWFVVTFQNASKRITLRLLHPIAILNLLPRNLQGIVLWFFITTHVSCWT